MKKVIMMAIITLVIVCFSNNAFAEEIQNEEKGILTISLECPDTGTIVLTNNENEEKYAFNFTKENYVDEKTIPFGTYTMSSKNIVFSNDSNIIFENDNTVFIENGISVSLWMILIFIVIMIAVVMIICYILRY